MQVPIPNDWDGTSWKYHLVCWPDSIDWQALLVGLITSPTRGRWYKSPTGDIREAQEIGWQIFENNLGESGTMNCNAIVDVLQEIRTAIQGIEAAQVDIKIANESTASSTAVLNANVLAQTEAIARSEAWAYAVAQSASSVQLYNNVALTIGPVGPTVAPPILEQEEATGISPSAQPQTYCDVAVYLVDSIIAWATALQAASIGLGVLTISAAFGLAAQLLAAVQIKFGSAAAPLAPIGVLASTASWLVELSLKGILEAEANALKSYFESRRTEWVCDLRGMAGAQYSNAEMQEAIRDTLVNYGEFAELTIDLVLGFFNPPMLALFYYASSKVTIPTATFDCGQCDE